MSVIEEALRRAQGPLPAPGAPAPEKPAVSAPPPPKAAPEPPPAHSWAAAPTPAAAPPATRQAVSHAPMFAMAALALSLSTLLVITGALWLQRRPAIAPAPAAAAAAKPATSAARTTAATDEGPALNGIVLGGVEPYAVINGTIVTVGDRIDGYLVSKITGSSVTLKDARGQTTLLQLAR